MDLTKYNTIIFDCDGVLLNSNFKKSEAYRYAAIDFGATKEQAEKLVRYHVENTGISRYVKFEYFLTNILQQSFNEEDFSFLIKSLNHKAAKIVELEKISCEYFAEITFKFLEEHFSNLDVTVNSVIVSEHSSNSAGYYRS